MTKSCKIFIHSLILTAAIVPATTSHASIDRSFFAESSRLSSGNWIKVSVEESGICQITYDQLRQMGFSNPEKVYVYGRGGAQYTENFTNADGTNRYKDDVPPVATRHDGNRLLFYAQGPITIGMVSGNVARDTHNAYSSAAYYFLAEGRTDGLDMPDAAYDAASTSTAVFTQATAVKVWEQDKFMYYASGEEYFGWNFKDYPDGISFDYSLPGMVEGTEANITVQGGQASTEQTGFVLDVACSDGTNLSEAFQVFHSTNEYVFYSSISTNAKHQFCKFNLTSPTGKITIRPENSSLLSFAALDCLTLSALRNLEFQPDEKVISVYFTQNMNQNYSAVFSNVPDSFEAWYLTDSCDPVVLHQEEYGSDSKMRKLAGSGNMSGAWIIAFDRTAEFPTISGYESVRNTNLHSIGVDPADIPNMVIITTDELKDKAEELAAIHKTYQGDDVKVVLTRDLINEFSQGVPDPMAYRGFVRMLYERDNAENRKFASLLLFGPTHVDNRNIFSNLPASTERLICKQTETSNVITNTFSVPTYYGMLDDYSTSTGEYIYRRTRQIAVGVLPCLNRGDADVIIDKTATWFTDESQVFWFDEGVYTADGTQENEHLRMAESVALNHINRDNGAFIQHKLYNNCYEAEQIRPAFYAALQSGAFWNTYFGHASPLGLNTRLWNKGDAVRLTNTRLGFMRFAGCTVSSYDFMDRGSGDEMIFAPGKGLIGAVITSRSSLSMSNQIFIRDVDDAYLRQDPSSTERLASPRTFGDVFRVACNSNTRNNSNLQAYVLMADPGLISPAPSASVNLDLSALEASENIISLSGGQKIALKGAVQTRSGETLTDFNGTLVVKICGPAQVIPTYERDNSPSINITHDDQILSVIPIDVKQGLFSAEILAPSAATGEGTTGKIRLYAMDRTSRRTADGVYSYAAATSSAGDCQIDDQSPIVESYYINSETFVSGDAVAPDFIMYARVTDNEGLAIASFNDMAPMHVSIDGSRLLANISQFAVLSDEGRTLSLTIPTSGLTPGLHSATLTVADREGNTATSTIHFHVTAATAQSTTLATDSPVARSEAQVSLSTAADADYTIAHATLVVTDPLGKEIYSTEIPDPAGSFAWNLTGNDGKRVAEGAYRLICRYITSAGVAGVTPPQRVVVIRPAL